MWGGERVSYYSMWGGGNVGHITVCGGGERVSYYSMWVLTLPVIYVYFKLYIYVDDKKNI